MGRESGRQQCPLTVMAPCFLLHPLFPSLLPSSNSVENSGTSFLPLHTQNQSEGPQFTEGPPPTPEEAPGLLTRELSA